MRLSVIALLLSAAIPAIAHAAPTAADPYIWLEEPSSPRAMAWVDSHNAASTKILEADPRYQTLYDEALAIAGAKDRIPAPSFTHGAIYNFWQDPDHLRGIWRKTTLADYRTADPHWTTVLDIDALGKAEGKSWVMKDVDCLRPDERRCLVSLSDGGEDAVEVREFDLDTGRFVEDGFHLPKGKHRVAWEDADHLLVATDWKPGELTPSGYPYVVKRLTRGQPMSAAVEVYRGGATDGGYGVSPNVLRDGQGRQLAVIERPLDTFSHQTYVVTARGAERLAIPDKADVVELIGGRVIVRLNEAWPAAGPAFTPGAVAELDLAAVKAAPGNLKPEAGLDAGPARFAGGRDLDPRQAADHHAQQRQRPGLGLFAQAGGRLDEREARSARQSLGRLRRDRGDVEPRLCQCERLPDALDALSGRYRATAAAPVPVKTLSPKFDALAGRGRAARGDLERRHQDPLFRRPPEGHQI